MRTKTEENCDGRPYQWACQRTWLQAILSDKISQRPLFFSSASGRDDGRTEPPIGPSWVDFPFTVNVTPLGALDLTSMLAIEKKKLVSY